MPKRTDHTRESTDANAHVMAAQGFSIQQTATGILSQFIALLVSGEACSPQLGSACNTHHGQRPPIFCNNCSWASTKVRRNGSAQAGCVEKAPETVQRTGISARSRPRSQPLNPLSKTRPRQLSLQYQLLKTHRRVDHIWQVYPLGCHVHSIHLPAGHSLHALLQQEQRMLLTIKLSNQVQCRGCGCRQVLGC
jgi:hypothetical protein